MSLDSCKYDNMLFEILQNEGQIVPFLDVIFSFLYRRTDYYKIQKDGKQSFGFPEGVSERLLRQVYTKYHTKARHDDQSQKDTSVPDVATEVEIDSKEKKEIRKQTKKVQRPDTTDSPVDSDCYNGADMGKYKWSQSVTEVDIRVTVPQGIVTGKQVVVQIKSDHLAVRVRDSETEPKWDVLVDGQFPFRVKAEDAIWTLIPGDHIHISLEKREERLWEFLLEGEPKLDTNKMDNTLPMENLDEESQSVVQELMYNQQQKMAGKLTSKEQKLENILREAWDMDGSPFKGQPFDMKKVNLSNPEGLTREF